jgi:photosystem II stability/assembly factor-like uncharacterized protein
MNQKRNKVIIREDYSLTQKKNKMKKIFTLSTMLIFCAISFAQENFFGSPNSVLDWKPIGPPGGNIQSLAQNPANMNELFAIVYKPFGFDSPYIYRTINSGQSWERIPFQSAGLYDVAIDPVNQSVFALAANGVYKSPDHGETWKFIEISYGFLDTENGDLAISPSSPNVIYASGNHLGYIAVFKSTDSGESWTMKMNDPSSSCQYACSLAVDPSSPDIVYVGGYPNQLYKTNNGGNSWELITGSIKGTPYAITIDPTNPSKIYVGTKVGIYRSRDRGQNWAKNNGLASAFTLAIDPSSPSILFAGRGKKIYKSVDGGINWADCSRGFFGECNKLLVCSTKVFLASTAGIYKSEDRGTSWNESYRGIEANLILALAVASSSPNILYTVCDRNGLFKSSDSGTTWQRLTDVCRRDAVKKIAINPGDEDDLYLLAHNNDTGDIFRSTDGGRIWNKIFIGQIRDISLSQKNPDLVFLAGQIIGPDDSPALFKSTNGGKTWLTFKITPAPKYDYARAVAVDPRDDNTIYISVGSFLFKSQDGGISWTNISLNLMTSSEIENIAIDPVENNKIYVTSYEGLFKSQDFGYTWIKRHPYLMNNIKIDRFSPDNIYFSSYPSRRVFFSDDGGVTLSELVNGYYFLDNVTCLDLDSSNKILYAGTSFKGVCKNDKIGSPLFAPLDFSAVRKKDRTLFFIRYVNELTWRANPKNKNIVKYRIYAYDEKQKKQIILAELDAYTFRYFHKNVDKKHWYSYSITAIDSERREGAIAHAWIPEE